MDDQVLEKVKECAISYLGMQKDDFVSVSEIFNNDNRHRFRCEGARERDAFHL